MQGPCYPLAGGCIVRKFDDGIAADDPRIVNTVKVIDSLLKTETAGFYLDNAKNVSLKNCNVNWGIKKVPYYKHAISVKNVDNISIENFEGKAVREDIESLKIENCKNLFIK